MRRAGLFTLIALLLGPAPALAQSVQLAPAEIQHFVDNNGNACVGCQLFTYQAGTTTPQATFTDSTGATPQTTPIIMNTRGEPQNTSGHSVGIWLPPNFGYKFVLAPAGDTNPPSNPFWTIDNIIGGAASTLSNNATAFAPTVNFPGSDASADIITVLGSSGTPDNTDNPVAIFQKWAGTPSTALNPAVYASIYKTSNAAGQHVEAIFGEAQDNAGWNGIGANNFVEGARFQGTLNSGTALGSAYGMVAAAGGNTGASYTYMIGIESNVVNQYTNAPIAFNPNSFSAAFLATNGFGAGSYETDAAYMVNQNSAQPFIRGFYVPQATGQAVLKSAFETEETSEWGLKMSNAPIGYGAIGLPNNVPIRGEISGDTGDTQTYNMMFLSTGNAVVIGFDAAGGIQLGPTIASLPGTAVVASALPQIGALSKAGTVCIATNGQLYYAATTC
jgi:hypothetical protein